LNGSEQHKKKPKGKAGVSGKRVKTGKINMLEAAITGSVTSPFGAIPDGKQ
jgi:hypothetical protein